ncbi:MAG TPA: ABC transporter permease [Candidatus Pullichristensenella stercorigallinarum]|uniref:ABC transporter permease n=1 Tax=Candidatus Pullichristensenella stercorigallinarum TaxID=2840909 RepID=A0A9D1CX77_9FIRM|nr:ABC transporter permease [Candidatus Pullichristensenella stercorigallinarum]
MRKKRDGAFWLVAPMAIWTILFVLATLGYILYLSFSTRAENGMGVTAQFTLDNYLKILNPSYLKVLGNSLKLAAITTIICLLVGYPFGYLMAKASPKRRAVLMLLVIVPFWTNALVRVYGWRILLMGDGPVNTFLLTLGVIDQPLKLLNTFGAVVLGMVYALLPFMILPTYSSVEKMDWTLVEASRDMGSSPLRAFVTVTLPLTAPGMLAGCVLTFVPSIGLFFMSDLLGGSNDVFLGNLINDQLLKSRDWPFAAALSVVMMLLTSLFLWIYRRAGGKAENIAAL